MSEDTRFIYEDILRGIEEGAYCDKRGKMYFQYDLDKLLASYKTDVECIEDELLAEIAELEERIAELTK